ncbi:MAG: DUF2273 domain-containing protein [Selenomonadaceae bacterium]|nr:DUF2273 domain-containing protein [Selenomonadaceae bacterium]
MLEIMWTDVKNLAKRLFATNTKRKIGFIMGVISGIFILLVGPFATFFMFFCGVIGLFIGSRFDKDDNLIDNTLNAIDENLPERFR